MKIAWTDIQNSIAFLCTRFQAPDEDNRKNMVSLIKYLKDTKEIFLTFRSDDTIIMRWYVDAKFAVQTYFNSDTGGTGTLINDSVIYMYTNQKLNTKSSTEAELVAADNIVGTLLWKMYLLQYQG